MNYIDITEASQALYLNINSLETAVDFMVFTDGSDTMIFEVTGASISSFGYYQTLEFTAGDLAQLEDETQYTIEIIANEAVVYRGKFQTTSKDINSYSINEAKYTPRVSNTNYTILD